MSGTVYGPEPPPEIAVVGIGCRFPGAANLSEYWRVLSNGENHISTVPPDRWAEKDFYDKATEAVGKSYTNKAGFMPRFADFDNKLFGISETEAQQMDPQQRQVLECTYMALENAGLTREQISGKKVGVYIGSMNTDFNMLSVSMPERGDQYSVAGLATSVIANRVSYQFNLTGPSMSIDTACSSSLVAIHQAILALRAGDCSQAICGGVNFLAHPLVFSYLCNAQMLSPTGQCHTFSNDADGYTRGEGCGIIVLKPLHQAISDGDYIWGTISTALNQDGHFAQPITAPSQQQQEDLLKEVFSRHQIDPGNVQYIEAHGTGTKRGDPVEIGAFSSFFLEHGRPRQRYIGSAKTNIGHLEAAAGVAGLIKVLLMMNHEFIVPSLNFDKPNELIDFKSCQLDVPTERVSWKDQKKVACLNSFGFGGANAHAVVAQTSVSQGQCKSELTGEFVVCFSGSSSKSLQASMVDFLSHCKDSDVRSLSFTSTVCREHFKYRKAWVVNSIDSLKTLIADHDSSESRATSNGKYENVVFVFCGMGTTWSGMCRDLMLCNDCFKAGLQLIEKSLKRFVSWSLLERLKESFSPEDPIFGPIAIFACQVALAKLWKSVGVHPSVVVGQSIGEVAAAHVCGILSLDEAVRVIYHRTTIMSEATGGKMLLIRKLKTATVETLCEKFKHKANIALYYSPVACSVSGDCDAIEALKTEIFALGNTEVQLIELNVTSAFHSHHMQTCQKKLDVVLHDLKTERGDTAMISSLDATLGKDIIMTPKYWGMNVRQPVKFHDAITAASSGKRTVFIEIGPKPVLKAHMKDIFGNVKPIPPSLPSMDDHSAEETLLRSTAFLYENGLNITWEALVKSCKLRSQFPRYAFEHKRIWKFGMLTSEAVNSNSGNNGHLFVKKSQENGEFHIVISPSEFSTVYEHKVKGIIVVPGTTYAETGFGIANAIGFANPYECSVSVSFSSPVTLKRSQQCNLSVESSRTSAHEATYTIRKENIVNAVGKVLKSNNFKTDERIDLGQIRGRCNEYVSGTEVYQMLAKTGFTYGDSFATISEAYRGRNESIAVLKLSNQLEKEMRDTVMHPAILDGMLQAATVIKFEQGEFFPIELLDVTWQQTLGKEMIAYTKLSEKSDTIASFFLCLFAPDGTILGKIRKFSVKFIGKTTFDVKNVTFRKIWSSIEFDHVRDMNKAAVFTNLKLNSTEMPWIVVDLDTIETEDGARQLPNCFHNVSQICFIYSQPVFRVTGEDVLNEVIKRLKSLRLLILEYVNQQLDVPIYVVMETRASIDCYGQETANCCLNEATSAFCRSVRREYKNLNLKTVEVSSLNTNDFISKIPTAIGLLSSPVTEGYVDIKQNENTALMCHLDHDQRDTPDVRISNHVMGAVLCSALPKSVVDPTFILLDKSHQDVRGKNETDFIVTSAVTHTQSLYLVTGQSERFGSSEAKGYPLLSLEFFGKRKIKSQYEESLACYPSEIKGTICIPTKCTMPLKHCPGYQPGFMLKLYTLWCMCNSAGSRNVTILHSKDTKMLAKALRILLKSMNTKEVLLLRSCDLTSECISATLLLTVQLTSDLTQQLMDKTDRDLKLVCLANIMSQTSLEILSSCRRIDIKLLHPSDIFAPSFMETQVPKIFKWIRSHKRDLSQLISLMEDSNQTDATEHPIKLSEVLNTREFSIWDGNSVEKMRTTQKHLIQHSLSYLVIGGLTGLGWESVMYLAKEGAGSVIIMGRRSLSVDRLDGIQELCKSTGCSIQYEQGDVTNIDSLKRVLSSIHHSSKPLAGIIFSAAVLFDSSLATMTDEELKLSLLPKISGAWNVHMATENLKLDIFLLHSSIASVFGNPGQSNYSAGNGFLDALASKRQECGLSGQSVHWGPLALGMLEDNATVIKRLENQGFKLLFKNEIPQCLNHLLMVNEPEPILLQIDLRKVAKSVVANKEKVLFKSMQQVIKPFIKNATEGESSTQKEPFNIEVIRQSDTETALQMLVQYVTNLVCDKALLDEESFSVEEELKSLGVDSMYAMEISSEILSECGVKISLQEIQLQSARILASVILERLAVDRFADTNSNQNVELISKQTILRSIAESFFGFDTEMAFDPSFVLICTVKVHQYANTESVSNILKTCLSLHSLARTKWILTKDSFSQTVLSVDEAFDLHVISGHNSSEVEALKAKPLMLETHGPVRFIFLREVKELIIVFHKFVFDILSSKFFVLDILKIVDGTLTTSENDRDKDRDIIVDIQTEVSQQMERLVMFWKLNILDIPYSSFPFQKENAQSVDSHVSVSETLKGEIYTNIMNMSKSHNLSLFEYLISVYQLLLAFMSKKSESTVTTSVDMRGQIPALVQSFGRCTNLVPLICHLGQESQTVTDFLAVNKDKLNEYIHNGLLPCEEMKALIDKEKVGNLKRNFFIFEDDTLTNESNKLKVEQSVRFAGSTETILFMWHKRQRKSLEMKFHLVGSRFTNESGKEILKTFVDLIRAVTKNPALPLRSLHQVFSHNGGVKEQNGKQNSTATCTLI